MSIKKNQIAHQGSFEPKIELALKKGNSKSLKNDDDVIKESHSPNQKNSLSDDTEENLKKKGPRKSILVLPNSFGNHGEERKDQFGNSISKGGNKQQRILFMAEIEEVHEVENWKEYNQHEEGSSCPCNCSSFQMNLYATIAAA